MSKIRKTKEDRLKGLSEFLDRKASKLKREKTKWEKIMAKHLSDLHYKFQFQIPIIYNPTGKTPKGYIVDFILTDYKIIIEVDGQWHLEKSQLKYDRQRTKKLKTLGYSVIRFLNKQVSTMTKEEIDSIIKQQIIVNNN